LGTQIQADDIKLLSGVTYQPGRKCFVSPPRVDKERMRHVLVEALKDVAARASFIEQTGDPAWMQPVDASAAISGTGRESQTATPEVLRC